MKSFWEEKSLADMTDSEWESLCDGCGKCCLHKLENEETGDIFYTDIACQLLNTTTCRCSDYSHRKQRVPDCLSLTPANISETHWLPSSCAYRLLHEGKPLKSWHPLLSSDADTVHRAGISVSGRVLSETYVHPDEFEDRIVKWVK
jgi:uncharacterized cysteine cluster protein YcgN (CxxCxxCC family)